jgi:hypothetical protein
MSTDWRTTPCTACGENIDLTRPHFSVATQIEEHDPPGHVMAIGYSTQVATYHLHDVPAHLDGRRDDLDTLLVQQQREAAELEQLRSRDDKVTAVLDEWVVFRGGRPEVLSSLLDALARAHEEVGTA